MPMMLKRHYGSSLRDWLGAAEYILAEGNKMLYSVKEAYPYLIRTDLHQDSNGFAGNTSSKRN